MTGERPLRSWVQAANEAGCDFPIQNLPYGVFSVAGDAPRCGVAIGDMIVDLAACEARGLIDAGGAFGQPQLNDFIAQGRATWNAVRDRLTVELADVRGVPCVVLSALTGRKVYEEALEALLPLLTRSVRVHSLRLADARRAHQQDGALPDGGNGILAQCVLGQVGFDSVFDLFFGAFDIHKFTSSRVVQFTVRVVLFGQRVGQCRCGPGRWP